NGVAVGDDCMTYSIGFRAPSRRELIAQWCDHLLADLPDDDRYADPGTAAAPNPGEITASALDLLHGMVTEKMSDRDAFARWFGIYNSARKAPDLEWEPHEPVHPERLRELVG